MKKYILSLLCLTCAISFSASAQLQKAQTANLLGLSFDFKTHDYILGEPVMITVKIRNQNTQRLVLGVPDVPETCQFEVRSFNSRGVIDPIKTPNIFTEPVVLQPGEAIERTLCLNDFYSFRTPTKYLVNVVADAFEYQFRTKPMVVSFVPGSALSTATQLFSDHPGLQRTFSLVAWPREQFEYLFVRIEDAPSNKMWATIPLGTLLRQNPPRIDISPEGEATILHRSSQYHFRRIVLWSLPNEIVIRDRDQIRDPDNAMAARITDLEQDIKAIADKNMSEADKKKKAKNDTSGSRKMLPASQLNEEEQKFLPPSKQTAHE